MCMLVETNAKIRRAFQKITCWKVVEWDSKRGIWTGPFYPCNSYVVGKVLKSDKHIKVAYEMVTHGLHTYADESDARVILNRINDFAPNKFRMVECEIPESSRFIEGETEEGARCYASERLKVVKFV